MHPTTRVLSPLLPRWLALACLYSSVAQITYVVPNVTGDDSAALLSALSHAATGNAVVKFLNGQYDFDLRQLPDGFAMSGASNVRITGSTNTVLNLTGFDVSA